MRTLEDIIVLIICFLLFAALGLVAILIYVGVVLVGYYKAKEQLRSIPGFSEERFARETQKMPRIGNLVLCSDAICYTGRGSGAQVIPIADIVWAYQETVQNILYLQIHTKDRTKHTLQIIMKKKYGNRDMACRFLLRLIARKNKGAIIGYKDSYDAMYQNEFRQLLELTYGKEIVDSRLLEQEYIENDYYTRDLQ